MKKLLPLFALLLVLGASPVAASKPFDKDDLSPVITRQQEEVEVDEKEDCDPGAAWKNHGQYVSCVAHQKLGGEEVSEAARLEIGKDDDDKSSPAPTPMPSVTPTPIPSSSPSPSVSPSSSPSATPSSTPVSTQSATLVDTKLQAVNSEISALIEMLSNALNSLKSLI
ncbi:MAG: hypothetical protein M1142_04625 [Patescibacteria group bacterium]|nr:hypothetical protein [Patescibacteria group bacterium]